jgi:catalase
MAYAVKEILTYFGDFGTKCSCRSCQWHCVHSYVVSDADGAVTLQCCWFLPSHGTINTLTSAPVVNIELTASLSLFDILFAA